jgi:septal ring factor EnvC (AmiA/AmiB activator)
MVKHPNYPLRYLPLLLLAVLLLGNALVAVAGENLDESRQTLQEIRRRIEQTSGNIKKGKAAERSIAADLKTVEGELSRIRGKISQLAQKVAELEKNISAKEKEIEQTRHTIGLLEAKVQKRLVALYKGGEINFLKMLFAPVSPLKMMEEFDYLARVVRHDRELITAYREQLKKLEGALQKLDSLRKEHKIVLISTQENKKTLNQAIQLKEKLLARVRRDQSALSAKLEELEKRAARLESFIKKLESEKPQEYTLKSGVFVSQKGRLPWPIEGRVSMGFGTWRHPELGTLHESQGIEITAASEKPILAVWKGRVIFADRFKGYGNLMIVDHGDSYYTLYAQASRLTRNVGDHVDQGETLAFSGSENLYFEIRRHGTPLDPTAWLVMR